MNGLINNWTIRVAPKLAKPIPAKLAPIPRLLTIIPLAAAVTPPDKIGCLIAPVIICPVGFSFYKAYFYWTLLSIAKST